MGRFELFGITKAIRMMQLRKFPEGGLDLREREWTSQTQNQQGVVQFLMIGPPCTLLLLTLLSLPFFLFTAILLGLVLCLTLPPIVVRGPSPASPVDRGQKEGHFRGLREGQWELPGE